MESVRAACAEGSLIEGYCDSGEELIVCFWFSCFLAYVYRNL